MKEISKNNKGESVLKKESLSKDKAGKPLNKKENIVNKEALKEALSKDSVVEQIKRAISVVSLKEEEIKKVSVSENLNLYALMFFLAPIVVSIVISALTMRFFNFSFVIYSFLIPVGAFAGSVFVAQIVAEKAFKKKLDLKALFRVFGFASIVTWPIVLPSLFALIRVYSLGGLFSVSSYLILYIFVVLFIYLSKVEKMKQEDSIITAVASGVAYFVVLELIGRLLLGSFYGVSGLY